MVADVIQRAADLDDPASVVEAIASTRLDTIVGTVDWSNGPVKNVCKTPLVAGHWQRENGEFDLKVVTNKQAPMIPVSGEQKLL